MLRFAASVKSACLVGVLSMLSMGCAHSPTASSGVLVKRVQMHMGTLVAVTAVAPSEAIAPSAVSAAFREIHRLEELLSTWIPTSELSHINQAAGRKPVRVSPDTLTILKRSLEIARLTDGAFNIAIGPAVDAWGFTEQERIPAEAEREQLKVLTDLSQIHLDEQASTVYLLWGGIRLDVGGIGKGFAADLAEQAVRSAGASAGVVALSGDIKTFGRMLDGQPFRFGIQHPRKEEAILATFSLQDEAISTAGDYQPTSITTASATTIS